VLGLPTGTFLSAFPTKIFYAFSFHACYMPCSSHILELITLILFGKE
jgi:hypothetical protein